ncbi:MAG: glycerol-3-phosphate acyltransferase [Pseudomonadota bacterium]
MFHDIMGLERALPWLALAFAVGCLAGSIPFAIVVARLFGLPDPRGVGSGNPGATNVLRSGHKLAGVLTFALDAAKAGLTALAFLNWGDLAAQAAALGAILGHCFSPWLGFRGGKGVSCFMGIVFALTPWAGLGIAATWAAAALGSRISALGALAASAAAPLWLAALGYWEAVLLAVVLAVLIWLTHLANIRRLLAGTEARFGRR